MTPFPIARDLTCRTCGYQLRGVSALGRCPECGTETMASIVVAADPALREIVRLASPRRTGLALLATTALMSLAVLVQMAGPLVQIVQEATDRPGPMAARLHTAGWWAASGLLLLASIASLAIAPRSEALLRAEWRRHRLGLSLGLFLWAVAMAALPSGLGWRSGTMPTPFILCIVTAWQLLSALAPLWGLRSILSVLGRRSRHWREARQGRQSVDALLVAGAGVLVFSTAAPMMAIYRLEELRTLAMLLAVASGAILAFGLGYLVMNAWWIARALVRPPVLLTEIVQHAGPGT